MLTSPLSPTGSSLGLPSPTFSPVSSPFASPNNSLRPSQRNVTSSRSRTRTTSVKRSLAVSVSLARGLLSAQAQQSASQQQQQQQQHHSAAAIAEGSAPPSEDSASGDGFSGSGRGGKAKNWDSSSMSDGDSSSQGGRGSGRLLEPPFQEGDILTTGQALPGSGHEDPLEPVESLELPKSPRLDNLQPAAPTGGFPTSTSLNSYTPTPSPLANGVRANGQPTSPSMPSASPASLATAPTFPPGLGLNGAYRQAPPFAASSASFLPAQPQPPPTPPKLNFSTPNRLEIVRKLGRGSYAVVYLVREVLGDPKLEGTDDDDEWDMEGEDGVVGIGAGQGKGRQYGREFGKFSSRHDAAAESAAKRENSISEEKGAKRNGLSVEAPPDFRRILTGRNSIFVPLVFSLVVGCPDVDLYTNSAQVLEQAGSERGEFGDSDVRGTSCFS